MAPTPSGLVVAVLPDVPALDRLLDYAVPARWAAQVGVGTVVRIPLQGRRVRGWVMATARTAPAGLQLREITKVVGPGPEPALIELAEWAAVRWAGRRLHFLRAATPLPSQSRSAEAPSRAAAAAPPASIEPDEGWALARQVLAQLDPSDPAEGEGVAGLVEVGGPAELAEGVDSAGLGSLPHDAAGWVRVLRWPPGRTRMGIALAALQRGPCLLLTPSQHDADLLARALLAAGYPVGRHPGDWSRGARGGSVVGSRAAAWASVRGLRTIVVFDEHDERYQDERTPTWHARDVSIERGRQAGAAVLLVSPVPGPEAVWRAPTVTASRRTERQGWPQLTVIDRRELDPREGLYPAALVEELRTGGRTIVVFNRTGRARLLACTRCGELCRCDRCGAALTSIAVTDRAIARAPIGQGTHTYQAEAGRPVLRVLRCGVDGSERPEVCGHCGATRLAVLRAGISRVREELEALVGEPVEEITAASINPSAPSAPSDPSDPSSQTGPAAPVVSDRHGTDPDVEHKVAGTAVAGVASARVVVGTSAVLHRVHRADLVVFLDLDQELLAPRYRAGAQALAQLALAGRILGGRQRGGRLVVQTRQPHHEVLEAVLHADPHRWLEPELRRRTELQLPPVQAVALLEGDGAAAFAATLTHVHANPPGAQAVTVLGPTRGRYLVRGADHEALSTALHAARTEWEQSPDGPRTTGKVKIVVDPPGI
ncbi:MAG: hypothetical protein ACKV2O_19020 [Acidimicrobiales bacterium]